MQQSIRYKSSNIQPYSGRHFERLEKSNIKLQHARFPLTPIYKQFTSAQLAQKPKKPTNNKAQLANNKAKNIIEQKPIA